VPIGVCVARAFVTNKKFKLTYKPKPIVYEDILPNLIAGLCKALYMPIPNF